MSRTLFENSKVALAFAAITVIGAVSMVGTSDDGGVLTAVVERFGTNPEGQASAAAQVSSQTPRDDGKPAGAGWGSASPASVFGEFTGQPSAGEAAGDSAGDSAGPSGNPMTAPLAPTAVVTQGRSGGFFSPSSDEPPPAE
jgi:hypothetical protein